MSRRCEMRIPDGLVEKIESLPGGIPPVLARIEKEFGLSTTYSFVGNKIYAIVGPNPDILELAIETLQRRYFAQDEKESVVSGEIENKRAVWKLQGDYASKASHLFKTELETIHKLPGVQISVAPMRIEIYAGYERVVEVKTLVDRLQNDIDNLHEEALSMAGSHAEIVRLRQFIQRKNKYDYTVICIMDDKRQRVVVYGRTESAVKKVLDEWAICGRYKTSGTAKLSVSPSFSYSAIGDHPNLKSEMKIPTSIVKKMERNRYGIGFIISTIEREYGLKVAYERKKHMTLFGPHSDILELAVQTLIHKYVIKSPPEHGVISGLQGKNAVWKFIGNYAKKITHLFSSELQKLSKVKTVTVKATPSRIMPLNLEILCSIRVIEMVKSEVEKIVGQIHNLFLKEVLIPNDDAQIAKVKSIVQEYSPSTEVVLLFDEKHKKVMVFGRDEIKVWQAVSELQYERQQVAREDMSTRDYWDKYQELFQTKIPLDVVQKFEASPGGIMPLLTKIGQEYGVRTVYQKNKTLVIISPSTEVLELTQETIAERYIALHNDDNDCNHNDESNQTDEENQTELTLPPLQTYAPKQVNGNVAEPLEVISEQHDNYENQHQNPVGVLNESSNMLSHSNEVVSETVADLSNRRPSVRAISNRHFLTQTRSPYRSFSRSPSRTLSRSTTGGWSRTSTINSKTPLLTPDVTNLRSNLKSSKASNKSKSVTFQGHL
ncbi:hypothetical protein DPMN_167645 [Dreissena polymorpha]|uniref:Uncharacterized protein n=1 Tax=Dreissena polymorpha TaxID=45954 RepID=A0A9D4F192_DREPO|nr:hypothetical protein DPMN_167645 [Dreissena polymorpha]